MILIKKLSPPPELEELKRIVEEEGLSDQEGYDCLTNPLKQQVRESLMKEQGYLCAYCMRRIPDERISEDDPYHSKVYIEHWKARSKGNGQGENLGLDYQNMFAVCSGNEMAPEAANRRQKKKYWTCDRKKADASLHINPLDEKTIDTLSYTSDGYIKSSDSEIESEINEILNLNCSSDAVTLPQNRKAVLDEIQSMIFSQEGDMFSNCQEMLSFWENESGPRTPYIGIAIWWLKDQIKALS